VTISIPIRTAKRLPKESGRYLISDGDCWEMAYFCVDDGLWSMFPDGIIEAPPFWCELPSLPTSTKKVRK